ncbi:hypothetical protein HZF02_13530 [Pseudomonas yamanorum]|nr:hypothetical protein HZF02_13530 [Pseudomonas yamanorum]
MTLITGYSFKGRAFLQADILLTSDISTGFQHAPIPTYHNDETGGLNISGQGVPGLVQKIVIVNDSFAMACAGKLGVIASAIHLTKRLTLDKPHLTADEFLKHLQSDPELAGGDLSLIILTVESGLQKLTSFKAHTVVKNEHLEVITGGSGRKKAASYFEGMDEHVQDIPDDEANKHGIYLALNQFATLLLHEFDDQDCAQTLQDHFGGGYELAVVSDGKIQKVSNMLYAFAEAEIDQHDFIMIAPPTFLLKSVYADDYLCIRSAKVEIDPIDGYHRTLHDRTFLIPPIAHFKESKSANDVSAIHFLVDYLCFFVRVKHAGNTHVFPFIKKYDSMQNFAKQGFFAMPVEGYFVINYTEAFREDIRAFIMKNCKKPSPSQSTLPIALNNAGSRP